MEKIKVKEYIRTSDGVIGQVKKIFNKFNEQIMYKEIYGIININKFGVTEVLLSKNTANICEHSFNIIELIRKGDYVNGHKVVRTQTRIMDCVEVEAEPFWGECFIHLNEIETIVTKEMFTQLEYKLGV